MKIRIDDAAEEELLDAARYYEQCEQGLGYAFYNSIGECLERIQQFPESAPREHKTLRRRLVQGFPFTVIYSIVEQEILILAIAHHSRKPKYWKGRYGRH